MRNFLVAIFSFLFLSLATFAQTDCVQSPEGEEFAYSMNAKVMSTMGTKEMNGYAQVICKEEPKEDGSQTIWFKNFFPQMFGAAWTHGTLKDGVITIPVQLIYIWDDSQYSGVPNDVHNISIAPFIVAEDGKTITGYEKSFQLLMDEKGKITQKDPDQYIGYCEIDAKGNLVHKYGATFNIEMLVKPETVELVEVPMDAEQDEYMYQYTTSSGAAKNMKAIVARDGDDVYFNALAPDMASYYHIYPWIKGTFRYDGKVHVPTGQYVGRAGVYDLFCVMMKKTGETVENVDEVTFTYANEQFILDDDYLICEGTIDGKALYTYSDWRISPIREDKPATPANAFDLKVTKTFGYYRFQFKADPLDVNGDYINPEKMSWCIYLDDQRYTFEKSVYNGGDLTEDMTFFPYNWTPAKQFDFFVSGNERAFYFYEDLWNMIGVQMIYTVDGVEKRSGIAYINQDGSFPDNPIVPDGIGKISTSKGDGVVYDLLGRRVQEGKGVRIVDGKKILR